MQKLRAFVVRHERHLSVLATVGGFILDALTLRRVDLLPETLLIYSYLATIGVCILFMHLVEEGKLRGKLIMFAKPWVPLLTQFVFGGLFSAFLIFYSKSATFSASWPFLLILLFVFLGTELFHKYNSRLVFQMSLLYFGILSFSISSLPLLFHRLGTDVFIYSGFLSLAVFGLFLLLLFVLGPTRLKRNARRILFSVFFIYALVNILYVTNVLPPIPLALKDVGVYHLVTKTEAGYQVQYENYEWLDFIFGKTVHLVKGEPVYVLSSIFTPVAIETDVVHRWEYWSTIKNAWIVSSTVTFPVSGGRDEGYRGFSFKKNIFPAEWRVSVETPDGRLIGRAHFRLVFVSQAYPLLETLKD